MAAREVSWETLKKNSIELREPILWSLETRNNQKHYRLSLSHKDLFWETFLIEDVNESEIQEFENEYKGTIVELCLSSEVPSTIEQANVHVPLAGSKIIILDFQAEAPFDANAVCKLIWDYQGENETVLWTTYGPSKIPHCPIISAQESDGIKKLAISCDNGTLANLYMSVYVRFMVIRNV